MTLFHMFVHAARSKLSFTYKAMKFDYFVRVVSAHLSLFSLFSLFIFLCILRLFKLQYAIVNW